MSKPVIDLHYLERTLLELLDIASPSGRTDEIVHYTGNRLEELGVPFELTRRGAIRATLKGDQESPDRAIVAHLDTLGAMTKSLKVNGRLEVVPLGHWSSRFAEGARVTVITDTHRYRGTILPLKASGHTFNKEVDSQPSDWGHVEVRVDADCHNRGDLERLGFKVGDFITVDPNPEITANGYVNSRHLDDKAGVASLLAAVKAVVDGDLRLPLDCHPLLTITEEIGSGASAVLHQDVSEMVSIDNSTVAPGQNSIEKGVTICMKDSVGPFDFHLTRKLIDLCEEHGIAHSRDVFRYYRCDSASALEAGNDIRTALVCFGLDASHGHERTHMDSLEALAQLLALYMQSEPTFKRDREELGSLKGFSHQKDPELFN